MKSNSSTLNTLFSLSRWLQGLGATSEKVGTPNCPSGCLEVSEELLSCSDLSSNAMSAECQSSVGSNWPSESLPEAKTDADLAQFAVTRPALPPCYLGCIARIQEELRAVTEAFPANTATSTLCQALAYVLQTKWNWQVKFCCNLKEARTLHSMPISWVQEVLVVQPAQQMYFIVDLRFRNKFVVQTGGDAAERYMNEVLQHIPEVYVGPLMQLFRDLEMWTMAMEKVFQESSLTLPPWRSRRTFQQLYKFCVECDATESSACLSHMGAQLSLGAAGALVVDCDFAGLVDSCGSYSVECLDKAMKVSQGLVSEVLRLSPVDHEEYDFDKEDLPEPLTETNCSGLSFLLKSH